jgi:putative peptidoglycan lipid II flippase
MQVPIGVLGQASGVASYPFLAAQAARGEKDAMWETLSATLRWVFFVSCAAAAITCVLSREVVLAVFKRGAFTIDDTISTASALTAFAIGIPFWCGQAIVSRGFFALKDTWTPTLVGTGAWILSLPAYFLLRQKLGVFGLALASSIGIFLHATALYGILMEKTVGKKGLRQIPEYVTMAVSGLLAALGGWYAMGVFSRWVSWETFPGAVIRCAAGGAVIAAVYFLCALLLGSRTARSIKGRRDVFHPPGATEGETPPLPPGTDEP